MRWKEVYKSVWLDSHLPMLDGQLQAAAGSARTPTPSVDMLELEALCKEGRLDKALGALVCMDQQGTVPSVHIYKSILQACLKKKALPEAKHVHAHLAKHGLESNRLLGDFLVATLVNSGGFADGLLLFKRLSYRTVFSWTAIISGYSKTGQYQDALSCYKQMQQEGVKPDKYTFVSLLKACSRLEDLEEGKRVHADASRHGFESDGFVGSILVNMYAKCGSLRDAQQVFDRLSKRDVVLWTAMIAAYAQQNEGEEALQLFEQMLEEGVLPNARTFVSALQACGSVAEKENSALVNGQHLKVELLRKGRRLHAEATARGFESDLFVASTLVRMYSSCGSIKDAEQVFYSLRQHDVVLWNSMIAAYTKHDRGEESLQIYMQMQEEGVRPNARTFVSILQACDSIAEKEESCLVDENNLKVQVLQKVRDLHAQAVALGFESDIYVGNTLITMYAKCGSIKDAEQAFKRLSQPDVVSWTAIIAAHAQQGHGEVALQIYRQMQEQGLSPNARTFVSVLQACGSIAEEEKWALVDGKNLKLDSLERGRAFHAEASLMGFESDSFVGNILVSMYAKCGSLRDAEQVFDRLPQRDVVSCNAMIAAYVQQDQGERALQIYKQMGEGSLEPDARTLVGALQACSLIAAKEQAACVDSQTVKVNALEQGRKIHSAAIECGLIADLFVGSTLVTMYARCGSIKEAESVFCRLVPRDVVSWTTMITAYAQQDQGQKALQLFAQMQAEDVQADEATFLSVLQACSSLGALPTCLDIHQRIMHSGVGCSLSMGNSLIHAYGKCGSMVDAQRVFESLPRPNVLSWTALIAGYARAGDCEHALQCYQGMCLAGLKPDGVTFLALLSACSHAGMVYKGLEYFQTMSTDHGISPQVQHYACVIDLVGRASLFSRAEELLGQMPMQPDLSVWLCLLSACRKHGNVALGQRAFNNAVLLDPKHPAAYLLMANIYADAAMWECLEDVNKLRKSTASWKEPGQSWIQIEQDVHSFLAGDHRHPQWVMLYEVLQDLSAQLKAECYATGALAPVSE